MAKKRVRVQATVDWTTYQGRPVDNNWAVLTQGTEWAPDAESFTQHHVVLAEREFEGRSYTNAHDAAWAWRQGGELRAEIDAKAAELGIDLKQSRTYLLWVEQAPVKE